MGDILDIREVELWFSEELQVNAVDGPKPALRLALGHMSSFERVAVLLEVGAKARKLSQVAKALALPGVDQIMPRPAKPPLQGVRDHSQRQQPRALDQVAVSGNGSPVEPGRHADRDVSLVLFRRKLQKLRLQLLQQGEPFWGQTRPWVRTGKPRLHPLGRHPRGSSDHTPR